MPRRISTIIASVFQFEAIVRQEGRRGRRIAVPAAVVRGLFHTGWNGRELRAVIGGLAWTGVSRRMGKSRVLALPAGCVGGVGDAVVIELWAVGLTPKTYCED